MIDTMNGTGLDRMLSIHAVSLRIHLHGMKLLQVRFPCMDSERLLPTQWRYSLVSFNQSVTASDQASATTDQKYMHSSTACVMPIAVSASVFAAEPFVMVNRVLNMFMHACQIKAAA
jgi:hypothetical protein